MGSFSWRKPETHQKQETPHGIPVRRYAVTPIVRAGDRTRTGDVQLGKLAFYQLKYARVTLRNAM